MAWSSSTLRDVYEARLESYSLEGSGSGYEPTLFLCFSKLSSSVVTNSSSSFSV